MSIWYQENFRKYAHNTGWLFLEKIIRFLVTLIVWALVIRYLGPEQFGIFSYALSYVFLFSILADLGMEAVLVKDIVESPQKSPRILGSAFVLKIIGTTIAYILIALSLYVFSHDPFEQWVVFLMSLRLLFVPFNHIESYFQSKVLSKYTVFAQLLALGMTTVLCIAFVLSQKPLIFFIWVVLLEVALTAGGALFFYHRLSGQRWIPEKAVISDLLARSWPLVISGLAISIYMRLDQLMIKHMLTTADVGQFAVAVRISEAFYFIPMVLASSLYPAIVASKMKNLRIYHDRLIALNTLLIWTALSMSALISLCAEPLVRFLFGDEYHKAVPVLLVQVWASVFVFLGILRTKWAVNEGLQGFSMYMTLVGAAINVILNLIFIPLWGIIAAAWATVIAQFFVAVLSNIFHPKARVFLGMQIQALNPVHLWKKYEYNG